MSASAKKPKLGVRTQKAEETDKNQVVVLGSRSPEGRKSPKKDKARVFTAIIQQDFPARIRAAISFVNKTGESVMIGTQNRRGEFTAEFELVPSSAIDIKDAEWIPKISRDAASKLGDELFVRTKKVGFGVRIRRSNGAVAILRKCRKHLVKNVTLL